MILIKSDSRYPLDRKLIRKKVTNELQHHKINREVEISIAVVGSRKMKELNKEYRKIDKPTNVLSFPLDDGDIPNQNPPNPLLKKESLPSPARRGEGGGIRSGTENLQGFVTPPDKILYLGDIAICYPVARQQAAEYQLMVNDWISDLAVHGTQHLLGIHHE